jgi:hypothetical protein
VSGALRTKLQAPISKLQKSSKLQPSKYTARQSPKQNWGLMFGVSLELGNWRLELDHRHGYLSHAFARDKAFIQPAQSFFRVAGFMVETKRRSICHCAAISDWSFQNPTASPAK